MTGTTLSTTIPARMAIRPDLIPARAVFCAAAVGSAVRTTAARRIASGSRPTSAATTAGFVVRWGLRSASHFVLFPLAPGRVLGLSSLAVRGSGKEQSRVGEIGLKGGARLVATSTPDIQPPPLFRGGSETRLPHRPTASPADHASYAPGWLPDGPGLPARSGFCPTADGSRRPIRRSHDTRYCGANVMGAPYPADRGAVVEAGWLPASGRTRAMGVGAGLELACAIPRSDRRWFRSPIRGQTYSVSPSSRAAPGGFLGSLLLTDPAFVARRPALQNALYVTSCRVKEGLRLPPSFWLFEGRPTPGTPPATTGHRSTALLRQATSATGRWSTCPNVRMKLGDGSWPSRRCQAIASFSELQCTAQASALAQAGARVVTL